MHLRSCLLSRPSVGNPLDNKAHFMENTRQTLDLEGLHYEMHGIAEQIRIMNESNARLIQHLATNNPSLPVAPILEEANRSRHSHRLSNHDSQSRHSTSRAHLTRRSRSRTTSESRSSNQTHDTGCEKTKRRGRSPHWGDKTHKCPDKSTIQKIRDLDARTDAVNTGANAPITVDDLIR
ncbi:hypothetical protein Acr_00g0036830 [Actinidia rufa]|uniref:Uncharacterized protein n=1 Tax=Actinidia rufa TaxID=165716 RepID=A0A7J0DIK7_9ERIC|nr:hypothetical protein Acr_00g0036830 [Actinidia rufa]